MGLFEILGLKQKKQSQQETQKETNYEFAQRETAYGLNSSSDLALKNSSEGRYRNNTRPAQAESLKDLTDFPSLLADLYIWPSKQKAIYNAIQAGQQLPVEELPSKVCQIIGNVHTPADEKKKLATALTTAVSYDKRDEKGNNVLHMLMDDSYHKPYDEICYNAFSYLKDRADINGKNKAGLTPLAVHCSQRPFCDYAESQSNDDITYEKLKFEALIQAGADTHTTDSAGNTILHIAVQHKNFQFIPWILEVAPDLAQVKNHDGKTADELAPKGTFLLYTEMPYYMAYAADHMKERIGKMNEIDRLAIFSALRLAYPQEVKRANNMPLIAVQKCKEHQIG